jgi:predicted DNA-binding transcriptional regulator AlpA
MQKSESHASMDLVRAQEAAKILCVSGSLFRKLMLKGEGPPSIPMGCSRLFSVASLHRWMMDRESK